MRAILSVVAVLCLVAGVLAAHVYPADDATSILAAAREALGGDQKLAAVTSFSATGRTRQLRGNNLVPIVFELWCELPGKYVRKDEIPAQESDPTSSGFNGDSLIQIPPPPAMPATVAMPGAPRPAAPAAQPVVGRTGAPAPAAAPPGPSTPQPATSTTPGGTAPGPGAIKSGPPPDPRKARLTTVKQDFVKLTLGMFAASLSSYPVTFTHVGQAEAPQGKADILEVTGAGTFTLKFFINSQTHLPIMVSWTVPATNAVLIALGQTPPENLPPGSIIVEVPAPPAGTAPKEEQAQYAKDLQVLRTKALAGKLVEHRLYYADYRDIGNGLRFPFRLRRAIAGETVEETSFDGFTINRRIDPKRFDALK